MYFPYKPILVLSIIQNVEPRDFFNKEIKISDKIIKSYYDILMNSSTINDIFKIMNKEFSWFIGFDKNTKKLSEITCLVHL